MKYCESCLQGLKDDLDEHVSELRSEVRNATGRSLEVEGVPNLSALSERMDQLWSKCTEWDLGFRELQWKVSKLSEQILGRKSFVLKKSVSLEDVGSCWSYWPSLQTVEKMEVLDVFQGGFHALSTVWISLLFWFRTFHSMLMKLSLGTFNRLFCVTNLQSWSFRQDSHPTLGWYCFAGRAVCLKRRAGRMSRRDEASRRSKEIVRSMYFSCNHKGIAGSSRTSYSTLATNCGFNGWDGSLSPCSQRGSAQLEVGNYLACGRARGSFEMLGRDNGNANRGSWWCCDNARWTSRRATEWWDVTDENGPS